MAGPLESESRRVGPLELFFDLVFVFALTQVTGLVSANPTWTGLGQGLLVLGAVWWAWGAYSWLTTTIDAGGAVGRLAVMTAMAAMLVVALATPQAFGADALLFACAYLVVRVVHIGVYAAASEDVGVRAAARALAPTSVTAPLLLVAAGFLDGPAQAALWCAALAIDYSGPYLRGVAGLTVAASHFAERYGLIVIIALGESIVAVGIGVAGVELGAGEIAAAAAGLAIAAALWWTYFGTTAAAAERRLAAEAGPARARLARDAYSYLHLPMIAGVVLVAVAIKKTVGHVAEPLELVPAVALGGGVALYLLAHAGFRLRALGVLDIRRTAAAAVAAMLVPLALAAPALAALVAAAGLLAALAVAESLGARQPEVATPV